MLIISKEEVRCFLLKSQWYVRAQMKSFAATVFFIFYVLLFFSRSAPGCAPGDMIYDVQTDRTARCV